MMENVFKTRRSDKPRKGSDEVPAAADLDFSQFQVGEVVLQVGDFDNCPTFRACPVVHPISDTSP